MDLQANEALLQPKEGDEGLRFLKFKQLKSLKILKSSVNNITSNTKFMFFMILSLLPFFAFIIFLEIEIKPIKDAILNLLLPTPIPYIYDISTQVRLKSDDEEDPRRKLYRIIFDLFPFHLGLVPLVELLSSTVIIYIAAKVYESEEDADSTSPRMVFYQKNSFKGPFITSLWVQLFSDSTLFGVIWAVVNHLIVTNGFNYSSYYYYYEFTYDFVLQKGLIVYILSLVIHGAIFMGLLKKFLEWSVLWNMGIVISVLEEESGTDALDMSAYYGTHCKRTGFELMLVFVSYSVLLRLPFMVARMFNYVSFGVLEIVIIAGLICLGSLIRWVAFVLYYYDCKAQLLFKKVDEEVVIVVKDGVV